VLIILQIKEYDNFRYIGSSKKIYTTAMIDEPNKKDEYRAYIRLSGLGMSILAAIGLAVFVGLWLDEKFKNTIPWFTISLSILTIIVVLLQILKKYK